MPRLDRTASARATGDLRATDHRDVGRACSTSTHVRT